MQRVEAMVRHEGHPAPIRVIPAKFVGGTLALGVGMALGAGMYVLGVASCVLIVLFQVLLHSNLRLFREPCIASATILLATDKTDFLQICEALAAKNVEVLEPKLVS